MKNLIVVLALLVLVAGVVFVSSKAAVQMSVDDQMTPENETNAMEQDKVEDNTPSPTADNFGRTLDLSGRGLTAVPGDVFNQTDLEVLNLSNNKLEGSLPAEVRYLQNLRVLYLSDNNFTGVPAEIGQLSQLEILDLSNNPITGLPYELGNLKNLKVLNLRGTNYSEQDLEVIKQGLAEDVEIRTD